MLHLRNRPSPCFPAQLMFIWETPSLIGQGSRRIPLSFLIGFNLNDAHQLQETACQSQLFTENQVTVTVIRFD